ncbi:hypothetical protein DSO57_1015685 [Entomophthora muscae]|nr:hypothetical protein DSO57_1015685 [Entomophthora muscae]
MSQLFLQPTIEGALNDGFNLYDDTIPLIHLDSVGPNIMTLLGSHLVAGIMLNPLEVVRTRLVAQTSKPSLVKYQGSIHAFKTIIEEEGADTLFWGKDIIPCALQSLIDPLFQHCTPLIIDRCFHLTFSESPIAFGLLELALSTLHLTISLPLETVRRRLQIQSNSKVASTKPYITAVRTRQIAYASVLDCAYRVATEEAFPSPLNSKIRPASSYTAHGMGALYKGFGFDFNASVFISVISSFTGIREDSDW